MLSILYEDEYLIGCVKPPGVLSELAECDNMVSRLKKYLCKKGENDYVALLHRLDKNVGGVMVFSKNKSATSKMAKLINERKLVKRYYAVVNGKPKESFGTYTDLLFKDSRKNKSYVVKRERKGVKKAVLDYEVKGFIDGKSLVLVTLQTGRTHQIRVQFASRKTPLTGDGKYGGSDNKCNIALFSTYIEFCHPITGKSIVISQNPPKAYPFDMFEIK